MASNTFQYASKSMKKFVLGIDVCDLEGLLERQLVNTYAQVHDILANMLKDAAVDPIENKPLSQDQLEALLHPYVVFGSHAHSTLIQYRKTPDAPQPKTIKLTPEKRAMLEGVDGDTLELCYASKEMDLAESIYRHLAMMGANTLTEGQQEFLDLYRNCIRA